VLKPMACVASVLAVLIISAGADDATPSIKEIMGKLHKGTSAPLAKLKTALKADTPDWKEIQNLSKDFVTLGACLPENEPPKGDKSAYEKRAEAYYENAKALDAAAKAEDKTGAQAALNKIGASCKACHAAHKSQ
jgi:cytochrome c556